MSTIDDRLPPVRTQFVGRRPEMEQIRERLQDHALVTIVGAGGCGKTRLAREVAARVEEFDEVYWSDLVEATSREAFVAEVARAVELDLDKPNAAREVGLGLANRADLLVVLDNIEQIAEPAAHVLDLWMDRAANVTFLATSRHPLQIRREYQFRLEPLAREASVELFAERARRVASSFDLAPSTRSHVERIVERLDDLPLAIELAASRANLLTPRQLHERLDDDFELLESHERDRPERHRTMHATLEWTWNLLSEPERATLAQSSVFRGGFTLEAAEAILDVPGADWVGAPLQHLVAKSLVRRTEYGDGETRFDLYELIRNFASDRLDSRRRRQLEKRHAQYYADLILDIHVPKLGRDVDNVVSGFWNVVDHSPDLGARAALASYKLLRNRGVYRTILEIADRALSEHPELPATTAQLYGVRARCELEQGLYSTALESVREGRAHIENLEAPESRVFLYSLEGRLQMARNDLDAARDSLREALEYAPETDDAWLVLNIRGRLAHNAFLRGKFDEAREEMNELVEEARRHEHGDMSAYCLQKLVRYEIALGNSERAAELAERAADLHPGGELSFEREHAATRGYAALANGEMARARDLFQEALGGRDVVGGQRARIPALYGMSLVDVDADGPGPDAHLRDVLRIVEETEDAYNLVQARTRLGVVFLRRQRFEAARRELELALESVDDLSDERVRGHVGSWLSVAVAGAGGDAESHLQTARSAFAKSDAPSEMVDDLETHVRSVAELAAREKPPQRTEVEDLLDGLAAAAETRESQPRCRMWRWRQWNHLEQLRSVAEATVQRLRDESPGGTLQIARDGSQFVPPHGEPVDLSDRDALRRILARLVELRGEVPGDGLSVDETLEIGWPDDVVTEQAGRQRVYTAIRQLRSMGLDDILLTGPDGYHLDPDIPITQTQS